MYGRDIPEKYLKEMKSMTAKQAVRYSKRFPLLTKPVKKVAPKKAPIVKQEEE